MRSLQVRKNRYSGPPTPSNSLPGRAHVLLLSPYGLWSRINCRSESKCQGCSPMLMANRRIRTIWWAQNPQFFCHTPGEKWGLWLELWLTEPQIRLRHRRKSKRHFWTMKLHKVRRHWRMTSSDMVFGVLILSLFDYLISQVSIQPNLHIFFTSSCKRVFIRWTLSQLFSLMAFVSLCSLLFSRRPFQILL